MKLLLLHIVVTAMYFPESDGLSVMRIVPNPTTAIVVPPDNSSVTLSWNYTIDSGEQLEYITIDRTRVGSEKQSLVSYQSSNPSNDGVLGEFKSRMNFSVSGDEIHLVINNLVVNDGGFVYDCELLIRANGLKRDSAVIELIVRVAAHNVTVVCNDSVLGQPMTCNCTADGDPAPTRFEWRASSGSVLGNGMSYPTPSVERTLNGSYYTCIASNGFGPNASKNTSIFYVKEKPSSVEISPHPNVTVNETGNATLKCKAFGGVPAVYHYKWQHNGIDIIGGENGTLTLIGVQRNQTGNYSCQGCNDYGCASNSTGLIVLVHPRIVATNPINKTIVNESQSFSLSCTASGNPTPSLVWTKTSGSPLKFPDGTTLNVSSASSQHNGTYQCTARNLAGSDTATFVVIVQYKPARATIVPSGRNTNVNETESITLTCQAYDGNPDEYWYKWQKNGVDLPGEENGTLELINVYRNQSGNYTCIASNIIGMVNNGTLLTVQVPPKITVWPEQQTVCENQPVNIYCNVEEGIPEPEVNWTSNTDGTILLSSHGMSSNYSIGRAKGYHSGNYSCLATNAAGTEKKTVSLHVEIAAKISYITPTGRYERNTPFKLECDVTGDPTPNVIWINNTDGSVLQNSTTETSYHIPNVSFYHEGSYRCVAENKCGNDNRVITITDVYTPCEVCIAQNKSCITIDKVDYCKCEDGQTNCNDSSGVHEVKGLILIVSDRTTGRRKRRESDRVGKFMKLINELFNGTYTKSFLWTRVTSYSNLEGGKIRIIFDVVFVNNTNYNQTDLLGNIEQWINYGNFSSFTVILSDPCEPNPCNNTQSVCSPTKGTNQYDCSAPTTAASTTGKETTPTPKTPVDVIIIVVVVAVVILLIVIVVVIFKIKKKRCYNNTKVDNREEHILKDRHFSDPSIAPAENNNMGLERPVYAEDGPTTVRIRDEKSKDEKKPDDLYAQVDKTKKSKKKPGELLYADLADFQSNVAPGVADTKQSAKKPEKYQSTDYASITDIIKEREGKSVKVPIAAPNPNIPNNGFTGTTKVVNGSQDGTVVTPKPEKKGKSAEDPIAASGPNIPNNGSTGETKVVNGDGNGAIVASKPAKDGESVKVPMADGSTGPTKAVNALGDGAGLAPVPEKTIAAGSETVDETSNFLNRKDEVEEGNQRKAEDILPQVA